MAFLVIIILINLRFLFLGLCFFVWICWWVLLLDFFFCWFCFMVWIIEGRFWIAKSTAFGNYVSLLICYKHECTLVLSEGKKMAFLYKSDSIIEFCDDRMLG